MKYKEFFEIFFNEQMFHPTPILGPKQLDQISRNQHWIKFLKILCDGKVT